MRRTFFWTLGITLAVEVLSFLVFRHTTIAAWTVALLMTLLLVVAWNRPWILPLVMFGELLIGGKGYLLSVHWHGEWSIRYVVFFITLLLTALRARAWNISLPPKRVWFWPMTLLAWVGVSTMWGVVQGISPREVFLDMNAFLYLPVIPLWWMLLRTRTDRNNLLLGVLAGGITTTALLGLVLVLQFNGEYGNIREVYSWVSLTKTGEIASMGGTAYRIFLQSQIYGLLGGFILLLIKKEDWSRWMWIPYIAAVTSVWISLSRSFWLGAVAGMIVCIIIVIQQRSLFQSMARRLLIGLLAGYFLFSWAGNFPNPLPWLSTKNALSSRLNDLGSEQASEARFNQIRPLLNAISRHPILGRGFGTTVTYYNPDPRIRGNRTTAAFELGYLDWWLDLGAVGLMILGWWMCNVLRRSMIYSQYRIYAPALVALCAVHLTTVYLNHPLGIGWIALTVLGLYDHE